MTMDGSLNPLTRIERPVTDWIAQLSSSMLTAILIVIACLVLWAALSLSPLAKAGLVGWLLLP